MQRFTRIAALVVLALAVALPAAAQNMDALPLSTPTLKANATVSGDVVRIGDLISNAGDVADVAIFRAPDIGNTGMVPAARIIEAVRAHQLIGVDTRNLTEIAVTRSSRAITRADVQAQIARFFVGQHGLGKAEAFEVTFDRDVRPLHVEPSVTGELQVVRGYYDQRTGRFDVLFDLPGSASAKRQPLRYTGSMFEAVEVAVVRRPLSKGDVIRDNDISIEKKRRAEVVGDVAGGADAVIGMSVKQAMRAGQIVRRNDLARPELVARNEMVTIHYEVPGIRITLRGKSTDSGALGDVVSVQNIQSKRTVQGTVTGPGLVTISPALPPATATIAAAAPATANPPVAQPVATAPQPAATVPQPVAAIAEQPVDAMIPLPVKVVAIRPSVAVGTQPVTSAHRRAE